MTLRLPTRPTKASPYTTPTEPSNGPPSATRVESLRNRLERYRPYLTLLARAQVGRRLRGKVDPDDLVQETFLAAVAGAGRYRGRTERELIAWLRGILTSRVLKLVERYCGTAARDVRREAGRPADTSAVSSPGWLAALAADQSTPSRAAVRRERAVGVAAALADLPADYREVLVARNIEGLSFPAIAERMGRSVGAVTMLWARAVRQFRVAYPAAE
jgi:RNA polymerase sigma-70 factor (ECF subfamily)